MLSSIATAVPVDPFPGSLRFVLGSRARRVAAGSCSNSCPEPIFVDEFNQLVDRHAVNEGFGACGKKLSLVVRHVCTTSPPGRRGPAALVGVDLVGQEGQRYQFRSRRYGCEPLEDTGLPLGLCRIT